MDNTHMITGTLKAKCRRCFEEITLEINGTTPEEIEQSILEDYDAEGWVDGLCRPCAVSQAEHEECVMSEIDDLMAPIEHMLERVGDDPHHRIGLLRGVIIALIIRADEDAVKQIHEIVNRISK